MFCISGIPYAHKNMAMFNTVPSWVLASGTNLSKVGLPGQNWKFIKVCVLNFGATEEE